MAEAMPAHSKLRPHVIRQAAVRAHLRRVRLLHEPRLPGKDRIEGRS
jgi:hypothetical protein